LAPLVLTAPAKPQSASARRTRCATATIALNGHGRSFRTGPIASPRASATTSTSCPSARKIRWRVGCPASTAIVAERVVHSRLEASAIGTVAPNPACISGHSSA
jgi:hypothetical protein